MSDTLIPLATAIGVASPLIVGLSLAVAAQWRNASKIRKEERDDCNDRIAKIEKRVERLEEEAERLRKDGTHWRDRWESEVRRNVELANMPSQGAPFRPPMPSDEDTKTRELRTLITDEALRQYVESTPPRPRPLPPRKR